MILANIISVVKENVDFLAYDWYEKVSDSPHLKNFIKLSKEELIKKGEQIFDCFAEWIETSNRSDELKRIGHEYYYQNFTLDEVIESTFIAKSLTVNLLLIENPLTKNDSSIEVMTLINDFFDHLMTYLTYGFTSSIYIKLREDEKYSDDELKKLFHLSSINSHDNLLFNDILEKGLSSGIIK